MIVIKIAFIVLKWQFVPIVLKVITIIYGWLMIYIYFYVILNIRLSDIIVLIFLIKICFFIRMLKINKSCYITLTFMIIQFYWRYYVCIFFCFKFHKVL